mmetsp:Transcript_51010/g.165125  ORF Transcript_51010/g.165125 Transcript_51010/m.165125 type:complete len:595 (+) Transcript_51010:169-1953(+)
MRGDGCRSGGSPPMAAAAVSSAPCPSASSTARALPEHALTVPELSSLVPDVVQGLAERFVQLYYGLLAVRPSALSQFYRENSQAVRTWFGGRCPMDAAAYSNQVHQGVAQIMKVIMASVGGCDPVADKLPIVASSVNGMQASVLAGRNALSVRITGVITFLALDSQSFFQFAQQVVLEACPLRASFLYVREDRIEYVDPMFLAPQPPPLPGASSLAGQPLLPRWQGGPAAPEAFPLGPQMPPVAAPVSAPVVAAPAIAGVVPEAPSAPPSLPPSAAPSPLPPATQPGAAPPTSAAAAPAAPATVAAADEASAEAETSEGLAAAAASAPAGPISWAAMAARNKAAGASASPFVAAGGGGKGQSHAAASATLAPAVAAATLASAASAGKDASATSSAMPAEPSSPSSAAAGAAAADGANGTARVIVKLWVSNIPTEDARDFLPPSVTGVEVCEALNKCLKELLPRHQGEVIEVDRKDERKSYSFASCDVQTAKELVQLSRQRKVFLRGERLVLEPSNYNSADGQDAIYALGAGGRRPHWHEDRGGGGGRGGFGGGKGRGKKGWGSKGGDGDHDSSGWAPRGRGNSGVTGGDYWRSR